MSKALVQLKYGNHQIRWGGTKEKPYFVAQDVCDILGIQNARSAVNEFAADEKGVENIYTLGGKQAMTVVYEPGLYRLIFRSTKPEAETFRRWVFHEVLPAIRRTGEYRAKRRDKYRQIGLSPEWIETREEGIEVRKTFTGTLQAHGVREGQHFAMCTNAIYSPLFGGSATEIKKKRQLPVKANVRDHLEVKELLQVALSEIVSQEKIETENRQGFSICWNACKEASTAIAAASNTSRQISQ